MATELGYVSEAHNAQAEVRKLVKDLTEALRFIGKLEAKLADADNEVERLKGERLRLPLKRVES